MNYTNQQFEKLPKWAKLEIKSLQNSKQYLTQRLKEYTGEEETNTYISEGMDRLRTKGIYIQRPFH